MPSRNKKNKNRAQPTSGTSATTSKNEPATAVKIRKDSGPSNEPQSEANLKFTITEAKVKLDQLQQSVDTIKSLVQVKADKSEVKQPDLSTEITSSTFGDERSEQPFETQTMKKKRNRNRNRNRNKNYQGTTDESGVSSTSGTNENSTHENSPTPASLIATILPISEVIKSEIKEEPTQIECKVFAFDELDHASAIESDEKPSEHIEIVDISKTTENVLEQKTNENIIKSIESDKSDVKIEESPRETKDEIIANTSKSSEKDQNNKEIQILSEKCEVTLQKSEQTSKDNEKQKKNRQAKNNGNKNQKEKTNADAERKKNDGNKDETNEHLITIDKNEKNEGKGDSTEVKIIDIKENKKSPNPNKKNDNKPTEVSVQQMPIEPIEMSNEIKNNSEKKRDECERIPIEHIEELNVISIQSEKSKIDETPTISEELKAEEKLQQIPLPCEKNQIENILEETKSEVQVEIKNDKAAPKQVNEPKIKIENKKEVAKQKIKDEIKIEPENKDKIKHQPSEIKTVQSISPKESKKSKGKKPTQPQQTKTQSEPTPMDKNSTDATLPEPKVDIKSGSVVEEKDKIPQVSSEIVSVATLPKCEMKKVEIECVPQVEKQNDIPPKSKVIEPKTTNPNQEIPSTSTAIVQPKIEAESKKLELNIDEITKSTTPVLTTPVLETPKISAQQEARQDDETTKIWKILEEASKSLEPVEIQMDVSAMQTNEPITIDTVMMPNVSLVKDEQETKNEAQQLVTLLETKKPTVTKQQSPQPKVAKAKNNNQQPKQSSPTKMIDTQPKKVAETKKKDTKPIQKNVKTNKAVTLRTSSTPEKTPDKIIEKTPDESPPIIETKELTADADPIAEVPLDVSIMPSEIEVAELNAESKNVQGSGFAPSVEQSTVEVKSLDQNKIVESIQMGSESKDKNSVNEKMEKISNENSPLSTENTSAEVAKQLTVEQDKNKLKTENEQKKSTDQKKLDAINSGSTSKSPSKSMSPEKNKPNNNQSVKGKEANVKSAHGKNAQNMKKSNGKPTIPPKPENLISSQTKKSQPNTKSDAVIESKTEKILVLTGHNEDDDSEDDYIEYKFMPRQVFISTICQSCKKPTASNERILCQLCQMVSYCCAEHVKNDEPIHAALCAALQEIAKKRGGHIYNNARILNNNDYRSLRVHTLNLCENFLKQPLQTYEREILLFPRLCSTPTCREWRQHLLTDCPNCGQVFYCTNQPEHLIESHQKWCKSVALYQKLVVTQSVSGRIEPNLPSRIQIKPYKLPNTINDVFKDLYKNYSAIKDECVFATLTQLATAPLTAYFATQITTEQIGEKFTIHLIGAELQFEADVLDIWETFFLHLAHNLMELTIVFCGPELNAENIPLDIISRIRMCRTCRQNCRIVKFDFQCAKFYHDYAMSSAYTKPDLICFFNPGFHHINSLNGMDTWSETIKIASSSGCPVVITSYTEYESPRDLERFQSESANGGKLMNVIHGPKLNAYASQRPERNFISDEIVPLIFKNYFCFIMK